MIDNYMNLPEESYVYRLESKREIQQFISENINNIEIDTIIDIWRFYDLHGFYEINHAGRV